MYTYVFVHILGMCRYILLGVSNISGNPNPNPKKNFGFGFGYFVFRGRVRVSEFNSGSGLGLKFFNSKKPEFLFL